MARRTSTSRRFSSGMREKPRGAITPPPSRTEDAVPPTVFPRGLHEPLHAVRIGLRRQLARGGEHEAGAASHRIDAALHLALDLLAGGPLEDRHIYVADAHHPALVAQGDEAIELVDLEGGIGLLVEVDGDGHEAHVHQVLVDLMRRPADVHGGADLL